jgi:multidrug efflux pump subunit AcrA (membrane-fusion protein)
MQIPAPLSEGCTKAVSARLLPSAAAALALAAAIACALTRSGLAQQPGSAAQQPSPTVIVEPARLRDVAEQDSFTGSVQAIDKAQIRTRVQGFIKSRVFQEGAEVAKDQSCSSSSGSSSRPRSTWPRPT